MNDFEMTNFQPIQLGLKYHFQQNNNAIHAFFELMKIVMH